MTRRFWKPFLQFFQPSANQDFLTSKTLAGETKKAKTFEKGLQQKSADPNQIFDKFFKEYYQQPQKLNQQQKQFFQKHYPDKYGKNFNPYQVLKIDKNATMEQIQEAYRTNALKYHQKVNESSQAQQKFNDISRAYNQLTQQGKRTDQYGQGVPAKSFFDDFDQHLDRLDQQDKNTISANDMSKKKIQSQAKQNIPTKKQNTIKNFINVSQQSNEIQNTDENLKNKEIKQKETEQYRKQQTNQTEKLYSNPYRKQNIKQNTTYINRQQNKQYPNIDYNPQVTIKSKLSENMNKTLKGAQLYSQSSYFQLINGQKKLHVTKLYEKDGRRLKVDRIQGQLQDGTIEVKQTLDDGKQIKHRKYIRGSSKKDEKAKAIENKS